VSDRQIAGIAGSLSFTTDTVYSYLMSDH